MNRSYPTRRLRGHPDPDQLKRQAKELLEAFRRGDVDAVAEVNAHYCEANGATFALHDAQLVLARAYGFESWPKLKAYVDGVTVTRLIDAVRGGDPAEARGLLKVRPELARMSMDGLQALHHAVLERSPDMVRVLMEHGANAREGVYPHRDATSALTIATERGYEEIVAAIEEEEQRRGVAAADLAARDSGGDGSELSKAVARGDAAWLRDRRREGALSNPIEDSGGLLSVAVLNNRPEILELLLNWGFDPDERARIAESTDEAVVTWGMPLWRCAATGKHEMAEVLLRRGADANASVYASGTPLYQAYGRRDWKMVELLERYGGKPDATLAGLYRQTELAQRLVASGEPIGEKLLWAAACGGDPEIVRMALELVDWPRDDERWFGILEQPLRIWNHGSGHWANSEWDRGTYASCFRLVLERCDTNVRGRFGLTILHSVAGSRGHVTAQERVAFATALLDAGARLDVRDDLLRSTPLGWACRWGRVELVKLLLEGGADRVEADAEDWARPLAWARKMGHEEVVRVLEAPPACAEGVRELRDGRAGPV